MITGIEEEGGWAFRPRLLLKAFWLPHLYACMAVVVVLWVITSALPLDGLGGRLRLSAAILQLVGLGVVVRGLRVRGTVFGKPNPVEGIQRFWQRVRLAFTRPRVVELSAESAGGGLSGAAAELKVTRQPTTLTERVEWLEQELDELRKRIKEQERGLTKRMAAIEREASERDRRFWTRVDELWGDVESALAGSYRWEWVAIAWLLIGMFQRALAEFVI